MTLIGVEFVNNLDIKNSKIKVSNDTQTIFEDKNKSPFISLHGKKFQGTNGKKFIWAYAVRPQGKEPVSICAKDPDGKFLFIAQPRVPFSKYVISFPAGLRDSSSESSSMVAQRELKEETGYNISENQIKSISNPIPKSAGLTTESDTFVEVSLTKKNKGKTQMEFTEDIVSFWATPKEFMKMQEKIDPQKILVEAEAYTYMKGFVAGQKPFCDVIRSYKNKHEFPKSLLKIFDDYC